MFKIKLLILLCCLVGLLACFLMWQEASLPPKDRELRLLGIDSRKFITENPYPESCIAFAGGIYLFIILGIFGLIGREEDSPEWHWVPALLFLGILLLLFLHQARRVNGVDLSILQPGHLLGLLSGFGIGICGFLAFAKFWKSPSKEERNL